MNIGPILRAMKHNRTRVTLIVLEIALTLAIVTNCVNVILGERARMHRPSGFDDDNIVRINTRPFSPEFQNAEFIGTTIDSDLRILKSIPGVRAVANTNFQLWEGGGSSSSYVPAGSNLQNGPQIQQYYGTSEMMEALGTKIVAGRNFQLSDQGIGRGSERARVALITKDAAEALFPHENPVGKAVQRPGTTTGNDPVTIIGVIDQFYNPYGMDDSSFGGVATRALIRPSRIGGPSRGIAYLARVEPGAMQSVITQAEKRLAAANPGRVIETQTVVEKKARWFSSSKIVVTALTCIIVALVAVTALGLLGLTSLSVTERTRQIGTRRALGATRRDIMVQFLTENWLVTTAGLALGIFGAYALNFALVSKMSADAKLDWRLVGIGILLLWVNGLIATIPPALRAMRIAPAIATRSI